MLIQNSNREIKNSPTRDIADIARDLVGQAQNRTTIELKETQTRAYDTTLWCEILYSALKNTEETEEDIFPGVKISTFNQELKQLFPSQLVTNGDIVRITNK